MYGMRENSIRMIHMNQEDFSLPDMDCFLFSVSNEERCYKVLKLLLGKAVKIKKLILILYEKYDGIVISEELKSDLRKCAQTLEIIKCGVTNEEQDGVELSRIGIGQNDTVGFDITGFAIPDIFRNLYVLHTIIGITYVNVFYTEPKYYCYQNGLFTTYAKNAGECSYKVIEEFNNSGNGKKEVLVCFLGFDRRVSKYVYDKVVPYETVVVNGFPSYLPKLKDISLLNNYELITTVGTEKIVSVRANSPYAAYNCLNIVSKRYNDELLNICVLGTKPMALGAALYSLRNIEKVKVSFPFPEKYKPNSSSEIGESWCYQIYI